MNLGIPLVFMRGIPDSSLVIRPVRNKRRRTCAPGMAKALVLKQAAVVFVLVCWLLSLYFFKIDPAQKNKPSSNNMHSGHVFYQ